MDIKKEVLLCAMITVSFPPCHQSVVIEVPNSSPAQTSNIDSTQSSFVSHSHDHCIASSNIVKQWQLCYDL